MAKKDIKSISFQEKGLCWETFPALCKSCGLCIEKCPAKCLSFDAENSEYLGMPLVKCDISKCIACHTCEINCPDCAIKVEGSK